MNGVACLHPGGLELTARLVAASRLPLDAAVLDVGCGQGATVAHLTDDHGLRAVGVDASADRVAEASMMRPDLHFVVGRAESLPFPGASFDAVFCECVLSTLQTPESAVAEAARVLRPGGAYLVSDLYARRERRPPGPGARPALGPRRAVTDLLEDAGFEVLLWTDESGALMRYIWDRAGGHPAPVAASPRVRDEAAGGRRLGYFSCLARRRRG